MATGNYALSRPTVETLARLNSRFRFFAFRLNDGVSRRLDAFLVANAADVLRECPLKNMGGYFLVNIQDVRRRCESWTFESDIP